MALPSTLVDFTNLAVQLRAGGRVQPSQATRSGLTAVHIPSSTNSTGLDHQLLDLGLGIDRFREVECSTSRPWKPPGKSLGSAQCRMEEGFGLKALLGKPQTCRSGEDVPAENVQDRKNAIKRVWRRSMRPSLDEFGCSASGKVIPEDRRFVLGSPKFVREHVLAGKGNGPGGIRTHV